jgi:anti-sigma factor RsiW
MECREVRDLADAFIGEELLVETTQEILRHLDSCPACRSEIDARRALRAQLKSAFLKSSALAPRPDWLEALGQPPGPAEAPASRVQRVPAWLALAAALVLAAGTALFLVPGWRGSSALIALARTAVGDHRNCAVRFNLTEQPIPLAQAASTYDATYRVLETAPANTIATKDGDITVVERHSCLFEGRRFAHVVMRYHGELVSLLMINEAGGPLTRLPALHAPGGDPLPATDGYNIIYSRSAGHALFFVTEGSAAALHDVADAVTPDLRRQLAGA